MNGRENNIKIEKTRRANGRKKIKTIYVLRFVLRGIERTSRRGGGKNGENPKIKNDLYVSRMHLLDGVNWMKPDCGLEKSNHAG